MTFTRTTVTFTRKTDKFTRTIITLVKLQLQSQQLQPSYLGNAQKKLYLHKTAPLGKP